MFTFCWFVLDSGDVLVVHGGGSITGVCCLFSFRSWRRFQAVLSLILLLYEFSILFICFCMRFVELAPPLVGVALANVHQFL
jgi:hypothetical protein